MNFAVFDVLPALKPYVRSICFMACTEDADTLPFRVLPDSCVEVFITISEQPIADVAGIHCPRSFVSARLSQYQDVRMMPGSAYISVCFHPGKAWPFFAAPMDALTSPAILFEELQSHIAELEERLLVSSSNTARVARLQQWLINELRKNKNDDAAIDQCISQIQNVKGQVSVKALAKSLGLCERQLNRRFYQRVGVSPKEFSKLSRFIFSLKEMEESASLTQLAYKSGYYDQSHFIHDFKSFAGFTPKELSASGKVIFCK